MSSYYCTRSSASRRSTMHLCNPNLKTNPYIILIKGYRLTPPVHFPPRFPALASDWSQLQSKPLNSSAINQVIRERACARMNRKAIFYFGT